MVRSIWLWRPIREVQCNLFQECSTKLQRTGQIQFKKGEEQVVAQLVFRREDEEFQRKNILKNILLYVIFLPAAQRQGQEFGVVVLQKEEVQIVNLGLTIIAVLSHTTLTSLKTSFQFQNQFFTSLFFTFLQYWFTWRLVCVKRSFTCLFFKFLSLCHVLRLLCPRLDL